MEEKYFRTREAIQEKKSVKLWIHLGAVQAEQNLKVVK